MSASDTKETKPTIQNVFAAFQEFQSKQVRITSTYPVMQWGTHFKTLREELMRDLEILGIAKHIDWTE